MSTKFQHRLVNGLVFLTILVAVLMIQLATAAYGADEVSVSNVARPEIDLSRFLPEWAQARILGIAIWQFTAAFICVLLGLVLKKISDFVFEKKIIPLAEKTPFAFDTLIATAASKPVGYLFLIAGVYGAFAVLPLPEKPDVAGFVFGALKVLVAADIIWFLFRAVDVGVYYLAKLAERTESKLDDQLIPLVRKAFKATIGLVGFVWVIQLFGYSVSSLLAGLGIGGLAVALA
ncbi:MAG: mechanosensitive ion channel, partial [Candidatus Hydrogenedentes bacterium]|nr:mechanosensitive ion channel [Candidatus Hydrogenedentota bacterium]